MQVLVSYIHPVLACVAGVQRRGREEVKSEGEVRGERSSYFPSLCTLATQANPVQFFAVGHEFLFPIRGYPDMK